MPRMELRGVEEGNPFYYNTEGGGTLSGFGTIRLWNTASNLSIYFDSSNAHVDNAGSNVNIYNNYNNCMIWNGENNVNIQLTNGISTLITGGNSVRINATGNASCWNAITGSDISINLDSGDDFVDSGERCTYFRQLKLLRTDFFATITVALIVICTVILSVNV